MLRWTLVVGLSLLSCAGSAIASNEMAQFDPVQGFAPASVSFDDRLGKGFQWNKELPCGANRATVTVKFVRAYSNDMGQMSVAKVWLHSGNPGDISEQWIAATIKAPTDLHKLNAAVWLSKVSQSESLGPGYAPADLNKTMQVDFAWTSNGVVGVDFGGEYVAHVTTDKPITGIGLGGSWAKFEFINFEVGRSGTPDPACATVARPAGR